MSLELLIYLADISENARLIALIFGLIFSAVTFFSFLPTMEGDIKTWKWFISFLVLSFFTLSARIMLPEKTTIYTIAAIKMGKEIAKNEKVIETSEKIYKILNQKLDEVLKEK